MTGLDDVTTWSPPQTYRSGKTRPAASTNETPGYPKRWQPRCELFVSVRGRVCCPVGSLNLPPHASVNWDDMQRRAKCTDGLCEAALDADASGVADGVGVL